MEFLPLIIDNGQNILAVIGGVASALGVTLPFLKPSTTKQLGRAFGKILKVFGQKKSFKMDNVRRVASTTEQFCEGMLEEIG